MVSDICWDRGPLQEGQRLSLIFIISFAALIFLFLTFAIFAENSKRDKGQPSECVCKLDEIQTDNTQDTFINWHIQWIRLYYGMTFQPLDNRQKWLNDGAKKTRVYVV